MLALVAAPHGIIDACGHVISKDQFFHPDKSRPHCEKLGYDVDAIAILLDHPDDAAQLANYASKAGDGGGPAL